LHKEGIFPAYPSVSAGAWNKSIPLHHGHDRGVFAAVVCSPDDEPPEKINQPRNNPASRINPYVTYLLFTAFFILESMFFLIEIES
jgi:hypothetical protein